jgi:hypothetical protein
MQQYLFKNLTNNLMCSTEETRHVSAHISHHQVLSEFLYITLNILLCHKVTQHIFVYMCCK